MRIIANRAKCLECGDVIQSHRQNQSVSCKCGSITIDGGNTQLKRIGKSKCEEACVYDGAFFPNAGECERKWIVWAPEGKTNPDTVFDRHEDAVFTAQLKREEFGGSWYVSLLQSVP